MLFSITSDVSDIMVKIAPDVSSDYTHYHYFNTKKPGGTGWKINANDNRIKNKLRSKKL
jgi:hypothetical protein